MNIGRASKVTNVKAKMIRYYESIGLLSTVARTGSGYRQYSARHIRTLNFIRRARGLEFSTEAIRKLLRLWKNRRRSSSNVMVVAIEQAATLRVRIAEMEAMVHTIESLVERCPSDGRPECPILDHLAKLEAKPTAGPAPQTQFRARH